MVSESDPTVQDGEGGGEATEATKREGAGSIPRAPVTHKSEALPRGSAVGRYLVIDVLGEGGMGVVYSAFDPELDRKVAIKLLQARSEGGVFDQAWLLREAQALARLSHPNVIAVHDVGTLSGDRVFVAMELVEGVTLRKWLKAEERTWQEALPVLRAAGAGLAAAHTAGLVHRDFKPDNVLVGNDGRVRVLDFGLARLRSDDPDIVPTRTSDLDIEARSPLSQSLTVAGSVIGTPAYIAPELYDRQSADARSDQFAFGVALYEALYKQRPFTKEQLAATRLEPPRPKTPPDNGVPMVFQRVAMRAIAAAPADRYPSMDALLADLAIDPGARTRRVMFAAAAVVLVGGAAGGAYALSHDRRNELCKGSERRLTGIWDDAARTAIRTAFGKSKLPFAARALETVEKSLDAYARDWVAGSVDACEATRVRKDQTEDVLLLRADCLDQRLQELKVFSGLLASADDELVSKAEGAAARLEPINGCANIAALRAPLAPTPEMRAKLGPVNEQLAIAHVDMNAGKFSHALEAATAAADQAKAIGAFAIEADARFVSGATYFVLGNAREAAKVLADATFTAIRSRRDDIVAMGGLMSARIAAEGLNQLEQAQIWLGVGSAAAARIPGNQNVELERLQDTGIIAALRGDLNAAATAHEAALTLAKQLYGADSLNVAQDEQLIGATYAKSGAHAKAVPHYEHALAILEKSFGAMHPDLATALSNLGSAYEYVGQHEKARAALDRSVAIREAGFGKDSPMLITPLNNIADGLLRGGAATAALPYIERAKKLSAVLPGGHPLGHVVITTYSEVLAKVGRVDEARTTIDELLAREVTAKSPILGTTLDSRAELELAQEQWDAAEAFATRGVAAYEQAGGKDAPELWKPLSALARAKLARGASRPDVVPLLERSIAIAEKNQIAAGDLAATRAALDKAKAMPATR